MNYGTLKNLIIENAISNITANSLRYSAIGLLSGSNYGEIINCGSSGELNIIKTSFVASNIGGLVGSSSGKIKYCYNTADVNVKYQNIMESSLESRVGGLLGSNESSGLIENSYNIGNVTSENLNNNTENTFPVCIGGVAGKIYGEIKNSYTTGIVTSIDSNNLNSYYIGSLVGLNSSTITNCYYLPNTVFPSRDDIQVTIEGKEKTSDDMKQSSFVDDLNEGNETTIWKLNSNINQGYPILYWQ